MRSADYVNKECAILLQKKGYPLQKVYKDNGDRPLFYDLPKEHPDWSSCDAWYIPTLWDVQWWFREIGWEVVASFSYQKKVWGYQVGDMSKSSDSIMAYDYKYPTYESALQEGIIKALEFV